MSGRGRVEKKEGADPASITPLSKRGKRKEKRGGEGGRGGEVILLS